MPPSRRDWIETTRYGHQQKANIYEKKVGAFLISKQIKFIHQAPFVIDGKIYFLDFFIPNKMLAIEVDGYSHNPMFQKEYDQIRDNAFKSIGIRTVRITNNEVKDKNTLEISLKLRHVI